MANKSNYTISEVEKLAQELCNEYGNARFFRWYCGVIYEFGVTTTEDLRARVQDATYPGKLFSKIVKERRQLSLKRTRMAENHGKNED